VSRYADAGVDLTASDEFTVSIADRVRATWKDSVVGSFGSFAAGVTIPSGYREPVIMMTTDGVGTKTELAATLSRYDGIGRDLVAMCVDDLAALGAAPIGFTDYLAVGALDQARDGAIVASVAAACEEVGCPLLGGETALHPGVLDPARFDVAGAAIGVVERSRIPDPRRVVAGDVVVGIESPNVRSNGFSLVRSIFDRDALAEPFEDRTIGDVLLEPSVLYAPTVLAVVQAMDVHGLVHVTGGGLPGNVPRVLGDGLGARIDPAAWPVPDVFRLIARRGGVDESDMFGAFNMGVGFVLIVEPDLVAAAIEVIEGNGRRAWPIGQIVDGGGVTFSDGSGACR
jgi:phosphoribosylformylglycinamidine cyclo-ligase